MGKGGMMKFCEMLARKVNVVTDTEIVRLERKAGSHLYTLFKRVRADVSIRGVGKLDSSVLTRPAELACGSFDAVLCCLTPRDASALMNEVRLSSPRRKHAAAAAAAAAAAVAAAPHAVAGFSRRRGARKCCVIQASMGAAAAVPAGPARQHRRRLCGVCGLQLPTGLYLQGELPRQRQRAAEEQ